MNERFFTFTIQYKLPRGHETPAVIGAKLLDSLDALSRVDPLFTDWEILDPVAMTSLPLAIARTRISTVVENNLARDDYDQPEPESGYSLVAQTGNAIPSRIVTLRATVGAVFDGAISLRFGDVLQPTDPLIVTYPLFREALLATSAIWRPLWVYVSASTEHYWKGPIVPGAPVIRRNPFFITWIAYLSPAVTRGFVVEPELRTESAPDGGLLMSATDQRFDPSNPEHLRRACILAETMIARTGVKLPNYGPD
jgi:Immunity protein 52